MARQALYRNNLKRVKLLKKSIQNKTRLKKSTRLVKRCFITGHSKIKFAGLSGLSFREFMKNGMLPGIKKSSW